MKKSLLALCLLTFSSLKAQITLEHTYNDASQIQLANLSISGDKYVIHDYPNNEVRLYNLNHSLWKTITIPQYAGYDINGVFLVSEELFDTDNLVELWLNYNNVNWSDWKGVIINENGVVIIDIGDFSGYVAPDNNNNFKMLVKANNSTISKVYSLPGTLPCGACGGLGVNKTPQAKQTKLSNPIPNPSSNQTKIEYELPAGVNKGSIEIYNTNGQLLNSYNVDRTFSSLILDNSELNSGVYYYQLKADGTEPTAKKMVIIK